MIGDAWIRVLGNFGAALCIGHSLGVIHKSRFNKHFEYFESSTFAQNLKR